MTSNGLHDTFAVLIMLKTTAGPAQTRLLASTAGLLVGIVHAIAPRLHTHRAKHKLHALCSAKPAATCAQQQAGTECVRGLTAVAPPPPLTRLVRLARKLASIAHKETSQPYVASWALCFWLQSGSTHARCVQRAWHLQGCLPLMEASNTVACFFELVGSEVFRVLKG